MDTLQLLIKFLIFLFYLKKGLCCSSKFTNLGQMVPVDRSTSVGEVVYTITNEDNSVNIIMTDSSEYIELNPANDHEVRVKECLPQSFFSTRTFEVAGDSSCAGTLLVMSSAAVPQFTIPSNVLLAGPIPTGIYIDVVHVTFTNGDCASFDCDVQCTNDGSVSLEFSEGGSGTPSEVTLHSNGTLLDGVTPAVVQMYSDGSLQYGFTYHVEITCADSAVTTSSSSHTVNVVISQTTTTVSTTTTTIATTTTTTMPSTSTLSTATPVPMTTTSTPVPTNSSFTTIPTTTTTTIVPGATTTTTELSATTTTSLSTLSPTNMSVTTSTSITTNTPTTSSSSATPNTNQAKSANAFGATQHKVSKSESLNIPAIAAAAGVGAAALASLVAFGIYRRLRERKEVTPDQTGTSNDDLNYDGMSSDGSTTHLVHGAGGTAGSSLAPVEVNELGFV